MTPSARRSRRVSILQVESLQWAKSQKIAKLMRQLGFFPRQPLQRVWREFCPELTWWLTKKKVISQSINGHIKTEWDKRWERLFFRAGWLRQRGAQMYVCVCLWVCRWAATELPANHLGDQPRVRCQLCQSPRENSTPSPAKTANMHSTLCLVDTGYTWIWWTAQLLLDHDREEQKLMA